MADVKDILGVSRGGDTPADKPAPAPKPKVQRAKRPEGMSREAFALLGDSHPIISTQLVPKKPEPKAKPKPSTKGFVTWLHRPIRSSARTDDLQLLHWVKGFKDAAGRIKEEDEGDYQYAKFNKKVSLYKYNAEEYQNLIGPSSGDGWTKPETDYLLDLCERFDLRWIVIADRYEYEPPAGQPAPPARAIEDLKDRYYSVARMLLVAREGGEAPVANNVLVRHPYNKANEVERKKAIELLLQRTRQQTEEDNAILAEAKLIEERLKAEAAPKRAPGGAAGAGAAGPSAGNTAAAAALAIGEVSYPDTFTNQVPPGQPSLFNEKLEPSKPPKPGAYVRGTHALSLANNLMSNLPGGQKSQKAFEALLNEPQYVPALGAPRCSTRAVCGAWLALRLELMQLHELRRLAGPGRGGAAGDGNKNKRKR